MAKRRTLDETRTLLIEAGASLLAEHGVTVGLENISMIDVCREAGLSTAGSAYKIWTTQEAFRTDVLRHLLGFSTPEGASDERVADLAATALRTLPTPEAFLRHAGNATIARWRSNSTSRLIYLTLLLASRHDDELAREIHDHDTASLGAHEEIYELIANAYGRAWTEPYDVSMLTIVLAALVEGLAIRGPYVSEIVDTEILRPTGPDGEVEAWSLYACAIEALIEGFTHPITDQVATPMNTQAELIDTAQTRTLQDRATDEASSPSDVHRRRSLAETRALLLDTAARSLIASGMNVTVGVLDLDDVCRHAGLTTAGSAYKIWETKDEYRIDLIRHLLALTIPGDETVDDVHEAVEGPAPTTLTETVRVAAAGDLAANAAPEVFSAYIAMWLAGHHDPVVAAQLEEFERGSLQTFADLYEFGREAFGLIWLPPFTADHAAIILSALVQGMAIRSMVTPERVPTHLMRPTGPNGEMQPWHLFACAVQTILEAFTQPAHDSL